jgi:glycosyltransferase involved in cell wall biosynthesis
LDPGPRPRRVDVVVAVRNEEENIPTFLERLAAIPLSAGVELRVLFVEDSSTDETLEVLRQAARRPDVSFLSLERGFGQAPAIVFGLAHSSSEAAVMMDADGSHPVDLLPVMLSAYLDGADVVQMVRRDLTNRSAWRDAGSAAFIAAASIMTGVDLRRQNVYFRLVSASVARDILATPRWWRFLRLPLSPGLGDVRYLRFESAERLRGDSKYDASRLLFFALEGFVSLISPGRLAVLLAGLALAASASLAVGEGLLSVLLAGVTLALAIEHRRLSRSDLLSRMRIREQSETADGTSVEGPAPPP